MNLIYKEHTMHSQYTTAVSNHTLILLSRLIVVTIPHTEGGSEEWGGG